MDMISSLSENVAMPCLYAVVGSNKTHSFTTFGKESEKLQSWHIPSSNQNIAMENHQFMVDFPIKHSIYSGFPVDFQLPCLMTPEGKEVMDSKPKNDLPWPGEE